MTGEKLVWLAVCSAVGGTFLFFVTVTAVCFYRRNRAHEDRKQAYLERVRTVQEAKLHSDMQKKQRKKGFGVPATAMVSVPPSPAAAAIPVSVAGPYHYYTDPANYTYDSFFSATAGGRHTGPGSPSGTSASRSSLDIWTTQTSSKPTSPSGSSRRGEDYTTSNGSERQPDVKAASAPAAVVT